MLLKFKPGVFRLLIEGLETQRISNIDSLITDLFSKSGFHKETMQLIPPHACDPRGTYTIVS